MTVHLDQWKFYRFRDDESEDCSISSEKPQLPRSNEYTIGSSWSQHRKQIQPLEYFRTLHKNQSLSKNYKNQ